MHSPATDTLRKSNPAGTRFLLAEIESGLTFLSISAATGPADGRERYLKKAHETYGIALRLLPRVAPASGEKLRLRDKMEALRSGLIAAGCSPDPPG